MNLHQHAVPGLCQALVVQRSFCCTSTCQAQMCAPADCDWQAPSRHAFWSQQQLGIHSTIRCIDIRIMTMGGTVTCVQAVS